MTAFSRKMSERVEEQRSEIDVNVSEWPERATKREQAVVAGSGWRALMGVACEPPTGRPVNGRVRSSPTTCCFAKVFT